jgi:uncharacterized membrane protein
MDQEVMRDSSGFRLRGLHMSRVETFTDAAFAFALTLLVVSLQPPETFDGLRSALANVPPFLLSASMLMMFWWGHHQWSRRYGLDDLWTMMLSCLLVFTVLIYVYPLRFMFSLMMAWIGRWSGLPLHSSVRIEGAADVNRLFVLYGIGFTAMAAALVLLNLHAWRQRAALQLDRIEEHETRGAIGAWAILTACGALSTVVGLVAPASMPGLPGWVYALLGVVMPFYGRYMNKRRRALEAEAAEAEVVEATG